MKRILLVDDDGSVLQLLAEALSEYEVVLARDGFEALAAEERLKQLDLLVTDFLMPSMTGDELIARVRERRPNVKVILITGHGDVLERESPRWWRDEVHLTKPFALDAFRERVSMLIGIGHPLLAS
jgi:CheY-like chemotaxis protein